MYNVYLRHILFFMFLLLLGFACADIIKDIRNLTNIIQTNKSIYEEGDLWIN